MPLHILKLWRWCSWNPSISKIKKLIHAICTLLLQFCFFFINKIFIYDYTWIVQLSLPSHITIHAGQCVQAIILLSPGNFTSLIDWSTIANAASFPHSDSCSRGALEVDNVLPMILMCISKRLTKFDIVGQWSSYRRQTNLHPVKSRPHRIRVLHCSIWNYWLITQPRTRLTQSIVLVWETDKCGHMRRIRKMLL